MELSKVTLEIFSKLEQQWLLSHHQHHTKTRILTIDGGGTSAIPSGPALIHLEHQIQLKTGNSNSRIIDSFDIIAGTGIGAVLAALITADDGTGRPIYSAKQAVKLLTDTRSEMYKLKTVGVLNRKQMFSGKSIEKVLKQVLTRETDGKVLTLTDTCKPLIVPCYDLKTSAPFVFSRADACDTASYNFELWKVCCATSSDPSMFKPFSFTSVNAQTSCVAVDGGLVMNNPSAAVVTHVLHNKRDFPTVTGVEDLLVLSIGNGDTNPSLQRKVNRSGYCDSRFVVGIVRDGVSETVDQMLGNAFCWNHADYVRIQANGYITGGVGTTTEEVLNERGVESLPFGGKRLLTETNGQRIENFVQRLVASGTSSLPPSPCKSGAVSQLVDGR
ncbi:putative patatin-like phospholipase domain, Acyl transferase/acyl hydrolase/lysophospholipase [Helianthus annuus]|nr:putative patatin-like phospholipase domain, Acyl transferase/acyl hydrolase/lysophospholipase [Helianthus annuus]